MPTQNTKLPYSASMIDKELELPETVFIRDIENKVFQGIVLQCLLAISGITLLEDSFIDSLFSRASVEGIKGITTEQDSQSQSIKVRIEVNIDYGVSLPEKAEEIQSRVAEELTMLTGLHVACIHVVFKSITSANSIKKTVSTPSNIEHSNPDEKLIEKEYTDEWN